MRAPRGGHCPLPVCVPRTLSSTGTDVWAHGGVRATLLFDPDGHVGRVSFCTSLTAPLSGREHRAPSFFPVAPQHPQMHADVFSRTPTDQPLGCFSFLPLTGRAVGSILTRVSWLTCQEWLGHTACEAWDRCCWRALCRGHRDTSSPRA